MRYYFGVLMLFLSYGKVLSNSRINNDTLKNQIAITFQPILNISPEGFLLQYLSINAEFCKPNSKVSFDWQNTYTYQKTKLDLDRYRSIEHITYIESEVGIRFYLKSYNQTKRRKKRKISENEFNVTANNSHPYGLYFRPVVGVGILHNFKDEISLDENIHRTTEIISLIPIIGAYIGFKLRPTETNFIMNIYTGIKLASDSKEKVIYISPLISIGIGVQF